MADFTMITGNDRKINVAIKNEAGVAVDVSSATAVIYGIFSPLATEAIVTKTLGAGIGVVTSVVTVTLVPLDTVDLEDGDYIHELQITTALGEIYTVLQGEIVLLKGRIHP